MKTTDLIGKRISQVRPANPREMEKCGWQGLEPPVVYVLDNGYVFLPARDCEMKVPGKLLVLDTMTGEVSTLLGSVQ